MGSNATAFKALWGFAFESFTEFLGSMPWHINFVILLCLDMTECQTVTKLFGVVGGLICFGLFCEIIFEVFYKRVLKTYENIFSYFSGRNSPKVLQSITLVA